MIVETLELDGHRAHRFSGRRARIGQQRKQMMERRPRLRYDRPARCRTAAGGEVKSNEAFDKRVVNARDSQPLRHHPVAEMCEAAKIGPDGTPCIASVLQGLNV